jgi:hypothetical protein
MQSGICLTSADSSNNPSVKSKALAQLQQAAQNNVEYQKTLKNLLQSIGIYDGKLKKFQVRQTFLS